MDDEKLVEVVARAICCPNGCESEYPEGCDCCAFDDVSRVAIAVIRPAVIEECARVADGFPAHLHGSLSAYDPAIAAQQAAREVGIAIRALAAPRAAQETNDGR